MRNSVMAALLLLALVASSALWSEVVSSSALELAFFDVGQGDAIFFETPQGHQVLIDGGPDAKVLSSLGEVMPFWDKSLDLVILTHADADHLTGLVSVLDSYDVETVVWTGKEKETKVFEAFHAAVEQEGANVVLAGAGQEIVFGNSGASLEILYPEKGLDLEKEKSNETSIIAMLQYRENRALLTGDTTSKVERRLLEKDADLKADILKIAHHGSKTSSSPEFLQEISAETAVISVGKDNRFGHPAPEVLERLQEYGIEIRRTDQEGTVVFTF